MAKTKPESQSGDDDRAFVKVFSDMAKLINDCPYCGEILRALSVMESSTSLSFLSESLHETAKNLGMPFKYAGTDDIDGLTISRFLKYLERRGLIEMEYDEKTSWYEDNELLRTRYRLTGAGRAVSAILNEHPSHFNEFLDTRDIPMGLDGISYLPSFDNRLKK